MMASSRGKGRASKGERAYYAGKAAEEQVARHYRDTRNGNVLHTRWRGKSGEIDLVIEEDGIVVCVEVKSSTNSDRAADALSPAQQGRIMRAGEEFCADLETGSLTEMRFDVALVSGDGRIDLIVNALSA